MHIHHIGRLGEALDEQGQFQEAYALTADDWVLMRRDGYIGAMVSSGGIAEREAYLVQVGLPSVMRE